MAPSPGPSILHQRAPAQLHPSSTGPSAERGPPTSLIPLLGPLVGVGPLQLLVPTCGPSAAPRLPSAAPRLQSASADSRPAFRRSTARPLSPAAPWPQVPRPDSTASSGPILPSRPASPTAPSPQAPRIDSTAPSRGLQELPRLDTWSRTLAPGATHPPSSPAQITPHVSTATAIALSESPMTHLELLLQVDPSSASAGLSFTEGLSTTPKPIATRHLRRSNSSPNLSPPPPALVAPITLTDQAPPPPLKSPESSDPGASADRHPTPPVTTSPSSPSPADSTSQSPVQHTVGADKKQKKKTKNKTKSKAKLKSQQLPPFFPLAKRLL